MRRNLNYSLIRSMSQAKAKRMFDDFDRRKPVLLDAAKEFYPLGVAGLEMGVENLADHSEYDIEHRILTTVPQDCLRKGASGFHGNLTSPARPWFKLRLPSFMLEDGKTTHDQRDLLDRMTEATEWVMARGNVYAALYKLYEHVLCFGFGCMLISADDERVIKAQTLRVGTYALDIDDAGQVNRVVRRFSFNAEQIISAFGDGGVTDEIKRAAEKCDYSQRWTVYNLIEPNANGFMRAYDLVGKACSLDDDQVYRSIYWLDGANDSMPQSGVLKISGFAVGPIVAPRMDFELGDVYGRGRGVEGIDLARSCQSFRYDTLQISGTRAQPAVTAPAEFKEQGLQLGRGGINYTRFGEQGGGQITPTLPVPPDARDTRESALEAVRELQDLFFNTSFATIDALKNNAGVKTATEVEQLVRENMERLAPVVTNFDKELLDPLVSIVVRYTISSAISPIMPEEIEGLSSFQVEYVSQIHLAQKQSAISAVQVFTQFVASLGQFNPNAFDKMNVDATIDKYAELVGTPEVCMNPDDMVEQARAEREQIQQAQMQAQQAQAQASAARDIGSVPVDELHAGGLIAKGLGQQ